MGEPLPGAPYNPWAKENQVVETYVLPEPEVPAFTVPEPYFHPLVKTAADNGWELRVKYARGSFQHATQERHKLVHWVSALFIRDDLRIAAIWTADVNKERPLYGFYTAIRNDQLGRLNSKELSALLKTTPKEGP